MLGKQLVKSGDVSSDVISEVAGAGEVTEGGTVNVEEVRGMNPGIGHHLVDEDVLGTEADIVSYVLSIKALWGRYSYSHFVNGETKA